MTKILTFKHRQPGVRAMRIILGETTKTQIMDFCPRANVGILYQGRTPIETDIRWIYIPNGSDAAELSEDGEWLVEHPGGTYEFLSDAEFHAEYEAAE